VVVDCRCCRNGWEVLPFQPPQIQRQTSKRCEPVVASGRMFFHDATFGVSFALLPGDSHIPTFTSCILTVRYKLLQIICSQSLDCVTIFISSFSSAIPPSMTAHHRTVLRLPRVDHGQDEPEFILVHVTSAGHHDLDLKLIGTEGNEVFSVTCK
jgi:hypothetical protein